MVFAALFAVQCSSDGQNDKTSSDATARRDSAMKDSASRAASAMNSGNSSTANASSTSTTGTMTPQQERMSVSNDIKGLRAELSADLDSVRGRLNDGTMPKNVHNADKAVAADLAQGLERVDRAIAAMDSTTDVTWSSMRDVRMKEVADVRTWLTKYRANAATSASSKSK